MVGEGYREAGWRDGGRGVSKEGWQNLFSQEWMFDIKIISFSFNNAANINCRSIFEPSHTDYVLKKIMFTTFFLFVSNFFKYIFEA